MSMDMGMDMFQTTNMALARTFWYLIAGTVGAMLLIRAINYWQTWTRYVSVCLSVCLSVCRSVCPTGSGAVDRRGVSLPPSPSPADGVGQAAQLLVLLQGVPHAAGQRLPAGVGDPDGRVSRG